MTQTSALAQLWFALQIHETMEMRESRPLDISLRP